MICLPSKFGRELGQRKHRAVAIVPGEHDKLRYLAFMLRRVDRLRL
jgi:hypothetical protein